MDEVLAGVDARGKIAAVVVDAADVVADVVVQARLMAQLETNSVAQ